jgi:hypothetical protein
MQFNGGLKSRVVQQTQYKSSTVAIFYRKIHRSVRSRDNIYIHFKSFTIWGLVFCHCFPNFIIYTVRRWWSFTENYIFVDGCMDRRSLNDVISTAAIIYRRMIRKDVHVPLNFTGVQKKRLWRASRNFSVIRLVRLRDTTKTSIKIAGVQVDILTGHLLHINQKWYPSEPNCSLRLLFPFHTNSMG